MAGSFIGKETEVCAAGGASGNFGNYTNGSSLIRARGDASVFIKSAISGVHRARGVLKAKHYENVIRQNFPEDCRE